MGVATKGRRKIDVNGRRFVWHVCEDEDSPGLVLHVASQDKRLLVHYHLGQPEGQRVVTVIGPEFGGVPDAGGCHRRFLCPSWEVGGRVAPAAVRRLVLWCLSDVEERVERDWTGRLITRAAGVIHVNHSDLRVSPERGPECGAAVTK